MKMRVSEIGETFAFWGKALLCMPVISVFYFGYGSVALQLDAMIAGKGIPGIGSFLLGLVVMAVYTFLCFRFEWIILYLGSLVLSDILFLNDSSANILTKIIMVAVSVLAFAAMVKYVRIPKNHRKTMIKSAAKKLPPEKEARYRATLAKLPSNYQLFLRYCSAQPKGEAQRMAQDLPTLFFHYVPCREGLEYIYRQNPENALLLVDLFIKFDAQGNLIVK